MPYISREDDRRVELRNGDSARIAGELNYQIFYYIKHVELGNDPLFFNREEKLQLLENRIKYFARGFLGAFPNYQRYNDLIGCLILCGKEIKRRLGIDMRDLFKKIIDSYDKEIATYEDTKIKSNGDVE